MKKLTKADNALLDKLSAGLNDEARAELNRLWAMRDQYTTLNEITLPLLVQYCAVETEVKDLAINLPETDDEYDLSVERITKLQKILLNYAKILKIDQPVVIKSKNKFADLLLGGGK